MKLSLFNLFLIPIAASAFMPSSVKKQAFSAFSVTPDEFVSEAVASSDVVIFSKSTCPFCKKTKALFESLDVKYAVIELNERDDGPDVQAALLDFSGQRTVPNVFIKGKHLGGNDATQKANKDGTLLKLLQA
mmetsp:Transcript_64836/g.130372  ORF Transcript_64836/g.130372 Transcript_64836/m.130372 type:complete len:132 (+) Transcript_64836:45-440(+)